MKCSDCRNNAFFKYMTGENKEIPLCPICYLKRFEEKLGKLSPALQQIQKSLKNDGGWVKLYAPKTASDKPVWTGVIYGNNKKV